MKRNLLTSFFVLFSLSIVFAQGSLKGIVLDENENAVLSATVAVQGTDKGTITDFDGYYEINNLDPGTYVIRVSYIGYKAKSKKVDRC